MTTKENFNQFSLTMMFYSKFKLTKMCFTMLFIINSVEIDQIFL